MTERERLTETYDQRSLDMCCVAISSQPNRSRANNQLRHQVPRETNVEKDFGDDIEAEQTLMDANRKLTERFKKKIWDAVGRVWG